MFFFMSKLLDVLLEPLTWSALLWVVCLVLMVRRSPRVRLMAGLGAVSLINLFVFSQPGVANGLQRSLEDQRSSMRPDVTYDAVVLLGGVVDVHAEQPEGRRSYNDNVERLLATFDVLRTGKARMAIISGGDPDQTRDEAKEATTQADQLVDWGIERERIVVEPTAQNTWQNAVKVKAIADAKGWKDLLVVTSAFHMSRALGCFRAAGMAVDSLVVDRRANSPLRESSRLPRTAALEVSTRALREHVGRLIYRMQGYAK
jgi:uncharacterized SAM-binding protein YcdF (DUF218 family)